MSENELLKLTATRAAALIRKKKLSPVEYVDAVLARAEGLQPKLNCFITMTADLARAGAKRAEAAVMAGEALPPLHGIPVTIKDLIPTAGVRTTFGTIAFSDNVPTADDILVTRLKSAGAIMIGKTTTPEFGIKGQTDAPIFGITRNPWNLQRTPGGSSGGGAAAVAAGIAPLALGTDGAGSTRGPAACCGLVGLKGTTGALPYQQAREAFANVVAAGPLTRSIADATLMQSVLGGAAPEDPWTSEQGAIGRVSDKLISRDLSRLRIGYLARAGNKTVAADVKRNTERALKAFAEMGAEIEVGGGDIDWMAEQQRTLYLCSIANNLGHIVDTYGDKTDIVLRAFVEAGRKYDTKSYMHAMNARTRMFRSVQALFQTYDVLISPTLTRGAIDVDFNSAKDSLIIDGEAVGPSQPHLTGFMYPFNLTGHPALSVPSGFDSEGLPTGIQIIAARNHDVDTLRIGALLEDALPWAQHWPQI